MYVQRNTEARSPDPSCCGKALSIVYSYVCVCVWMGA